MSEIESIPTMEELESRQLPHKELTSKSERVVETETATAMEAEIDAETTRVETTRETGTVSAISSSQQSEEAAMLVMGTDDVLPFIQPTSTTTTTTTEETTHESRIRMLDEATDEPRVEKEKGEEHRMELNAMREESKNATVAAVVKDLSASPSIDISTLPSRPNAIVTHSDESAVHTQTHKEVDDTEHSKIVDAVPVPIVESESDQLVQGDAEVAMEPEVEIRSEVDAGVEVEVEVLAKADPGTSVGLEVEEDEDEDEDETDYDDPWFDDACMTSADLCDHLEGEENEIRHLDVLEGEMVSTPEAKRLHLTPKMIGKNSQDHPDDEQERWAPTACPPPVAFMSTGFSTAAGSSLPPLSEAAQIRAKRLFDDIDLNTGSDVESEDELAASLAADRDAKRLKMESESQTHEQDQERPQSFGFSTASRKKLPPPSIKAQQRALMLLQQADEEVEKEKEQLGLIGLDEGEADLSHSTSAYASAFLPISSTAAVIETPTRPSGGTSFFGTATGGKIKTISDEAKRKVMDIFADIEGPSGTPTKQEQPISFRSSSTSTSMPFPPTLFATPTSKIPPRARVRTETPARFQDISNQPKLSPAPPRPITALANNQAQAQAYPIAFASGAAFSTPLPHSQIISGISNASSSTRNVIVPASSPSSIPRRVGLGITPRSKAVLGKRPAFTSPFKTPGAKVGMSSYQTPLRQSPSIPYTPIKPTQPTLNRTFDLKPLPNRQSLQQAQLFPGRYFQGGPGTQDLPDEIWAINPSTAIYYHFMPHGSNGKSPKEAMQELVEAGCMHISQKWIDEHWVNILWKLASEVRAAPSLFEAKWNYNEVMRQLKYRYEREINRAHRSAIKRVQEQDSPSTLPMVLFVYKMSTVSVVDEATNVRRDATILELSDGWYRIRAGADAPLQRAIDRGKLFVGCKLAIAGARIEASKEGTDVLSALDKSTLSISGNSTCLAPWDSRLGFSMNPHIATLAHLTADGGTVPLMCAKITRIFPIAFIALKDKGVAPWSEGEEEQLQDLWNETYTAERARLNSEIQGTLSHLQAQLEMLSNMVEGVDGSSPPGPNDDDILDRYHASSRKASFLQNLNDGQLIHLHQNAREEYAYECARGVEEVEIKLRMACPARETRSFQVIRFEDAIKKNQGLQRTAQLQIWDAKAMPQGQLREGSCYLVSNLMPNKPNSWGKSKEVGEIFLATRRDSTWRRVS